jgi:thioredoxin-dependent adenylylsulfate APS reductase
VHVQTAPFPAAPAAGLPVLDAAEIAAAAAQLEGRPPEEVLAWAADRFAPRITLATSFGAEGCVLVDLIARRRLPIDVFTLDTGLLFPETRALWRRLEERYALTIRGVCPEQTVEEQAARHGDRVWEREPDRCCGLRKVAPLREALAGFDAWVSAIRRDQTPERARTRAVEADLRFGLVKVNPLAGWTAEQVWAYVREHSVPTNPLHQRGYPSIGCTPCTTPVAPGEDARAGRWRGRTKKECGLHLAPAAATVAAAAAAAPAIAAGAGTAAPERGNGHHADPFPVFLQLAGRRVVVVGGGPVAAGKLAALLAAGARVTVVAPAVLPAIAEAGVEVHRRPFRAGDLDGAWYAVAAATPEVNREVAAAAAERRLFVNAVDDPANASAYLGGVLRRGGVTVAVSTGGRAPALAGLLREALDAVLPDEVERWVEEAERLKQEQRANGVPMTARRPALLQALVGLYGVDPVRNVFDAVSVEADQQRPPAAITTGGC